MTQTDTHTYTQTDRHTHTLGSIATYSVKMTEYKNGSQRGSDRGNGEPSYETPFGSIPAQSFAQSICAWFWKGANQITTWGHEYAN